MMGADRRSMVMSEEEKKLTAYHEAGHAVATIHSPASDPIHKATIIPRGRALGMVMRLPERDQFSMRKDQMKAHLLQLKSALESAYLSDDPAHEKSIVFASFQQRYLHDRATLGDGRYDRLVNEELNNAYLISLGVYEDLVPAFKCLFGKYGHWQRFFTAVTDLIELEKDNRDERLQSCKVDQPNNM